MAVDLKLPVLGDVMVEPAGARRTEVPELVRRAVFGVLFVLAVAGAAALMGSALVEDAGPRAALQIVGSTTAVGFGAMASVLAWRWWGGRADR